MKTSNLKHPIESRIGYVVVWCLMPAKYRVENWRSYSHLDLDPDEMISYWHPTMWKPLKVEVMKKEADKLHKIRPVHFVIAGNELIYKNWLLRNRHLKDSCMRVTNRRHVQGVKNCTLHLIHGYDWNEPSEINAIREIVALNNGIEIRHND